jgi:cob(I)alamin adenosyltransferase
MDVGETNVAAASFGCAKDGRTVNWLVTGEAKNAFISLPETKGDSKKTQNLLSPCH